MSTAVVASASTRTPHKETTVIHFTAEGRIKKLGLNLYRAKGGFVASWVWYDLAKHEIHGWRFRLRLHMKPRIIWSVERASVITSYLNVHGLELVNKEVLHDLKLVQASFMQASEP